MALHSHDFGSPSGLPLSAVLASIPSYPRPIVERLVARLIERLDEEDGDPDLEDDDPSGQCDEDGVNTGDVTVYIHGRRFTGPGCPIADPALDNDEHCGIYGIDQTKGPIGMGTEYFREAAA